MVNDYDAMDKSMPTRGMVKKQRANGKDIFTPPPERRINTVCSHLSGGEKLQFLEKLVSGVFRLIEEKGKRDKIVASGEISCEAVNTGQRSAFQGKRFPLLEERGKRFETIENRDKCRWRYQIFP